MRTRTQSVDRRAHRRVEVVRGVDGGVLANSVTGEALTAVLIAINRRYKIPGAGIRITGVPGELSK